MNMQDLSATTSRDLTNIPVRISRIDLPLVPNRRNFRVPPRPLEVTSSASALSIKAANTHVTGGL